MAKFSSDCSCEPPTVPPLGRWGFPGAVNGKSRGLVVKKIGNLVAPVPGRIETLLLAHSAYCSLLDLLVTGRESYQQSRDTNTVVSEPDRHHEPSGFILLRLSCAIFGFEPVDLTRFNSGSAGPPVPDKTSSTSSAKTASKRSTFRRSVSEKDRTDA